MSPYAKIVAVVMLIAMGVGLLAAQPSWTHARPLDRPAGCHEHGSNAPPSRPVRTECCAVGHNAAVPQTVQSFEPVLLNIPIEFVGDVPVTLPADGTEQFLMSSGDPPGSTPLRI